MNKLFVSFLLSLLVVTNPVFATSMEDIVERDGVIYKKFSQDVFNGKLDEGKMQGNILKGVMVGDWVMFNEDGQLRAKGKMKNSAMHGPWKFFNDDGNLDEFGDYNDGKRVGLWKNYNKDGKLHSESIHEGDIAKNTVFHENGEVWQKYEARNVLDFEGEYLTFHDNGQLQGKSFYKNGKQFGVEKRYYEDGSTRFTGEWVDGKEVGEHISYYKDGTIEKNGRWIDGKKVGKHQEFYENGEVAALEHYRDGKKASGLYWDENDNEVSSTGYLMIKLNRMKSQINDARK